MLLSLDAFAVFHLKFIFEKEIKPACLFILDLAV